MSGTPDNAVLSIEHLGVAMPAGADRPHALSDVSLSIASDEILCVVGESGSGKSMMANAIMRLLPNDVTIDAGRLMFEGRDLCALDVAEMREVRGAGIAMIFQEPMTALNPLRTIGDQIAEMFSIHTELSKAEINTRVQALLEDVRIPDPTAAAKAYPHELSGGQRQRAMIAMALALDPKLLIADEPTTALDVTIQAQIMDLLIELSGRTGTALLFITHNLGLVAETCARMLTMYAGQVVEDGPVDDILSRPLHPYTAGLLGSLPQPRQRKSKLPSIPGRVPSINEMPSGCRFSPRCTYVQPPCLEPQVLSAQGARHVRCRRHAELTLPGAAT